MNTFQVSSLIVPRFVPIVREMSFSNVNVQDHQLLQPVARGLAVIERLYALRRDTLSFICKILNPIRPVLLREKRRFAVKSVASISLWLDVVTQCLEVRAKGSTLDGILR